MERIPSMHTSCYNKELSKANQNVFGSDNIHRIQENSFSHCYPACVTLCTLHFVLYGWKMKRYVYIKSECFEKVCLSVRFFADGKLVFFFADFFFFNYP